MAAAGVGSDQKPLTDLGIPLAQWQALIWEAGLRRRQAQAPASLTQAWALVEAGTALGWDAKSIAWNPTPADVRMVRPDSRAQPDITTMGSGRPVATKL